VREIEIQEWGRVAYAEALERQKAAVEDRRAQRTPDRLILLQHPPVVTFGRSAKPEHLRTPAAELQARGIEVHHVARGGDVTYHGPGQLVGYLVLDLEARGACDVHRYLRQVEGALIDALGSLGVIGRRIEGWTGVFVASSQPPRKIACIGVGMRGWVTYHGFALNATMDLSEWQDIVPCGLHGVEMTSVKREIGSATGPDHLLPTTDLFRATSDAVARSFQASFS